MKQSLIEKLAGWLKSKERYRLISREIFSCRGIYYNENNTVHVSTVSDPNSETGIRNRYRQKYLERYYLVRTRWVAIFIHRFWASDEDPVHDHPWDNVSWVVKGGYFENLPDGQRLWRGPGYKSFRTAEEFHSIEIPAGNEGKVWSVFVRFRRRRKWGFWCQDEWKEAAYQSENDEICK